MKKLIKTIKHFHQILTLRKKAKRYIAFRLHEYRLAGVRPERPEWLWIEWDLREDDRYKPLMDMIPVSPELVDRNNDDNTFLDTDIEHTSIARSVPTILEIVFFSEPGTPFCR